jgi:hypothetical protein
MTQKIRVGFSRLPARPADNENVTHDWLQQALTAAAVSAAVMTVAMIAVVIGMTSY